MLIMLSRRISCFVKARGKVRHGDKRKKIVCRKAICLETLSQKLLN